MLQNSTVEGYGMIHNVVVLVPKIRLPETNSLLLKNGDWETILSFSEGLFSGVNCEFQGGSCWLCEMGLALPTAESFMAELQAKIRLREVAEVHYRTWRWIYSDTEKLRYSTCCLFTYIWVVQGTKVGQCISSIECLGWIFSEGNFPQDVLPTV